MEKILLLVFAYELLQIKKRKDIKMLADVKISQFVINQIVEWGGNVMLAKSGYSVIKEYMELFSKEGYIYDDGLLAACKFYKLVAQGIDVEMIIDLLPKTFKTSEIRAKASFQQQYLLFEKLNDYLLKEGLEFSTLDGIRVSSDKAW